MKLANITVGGGAGRIGALDPVVMNAIGSHHVVEAWKTEATADVSKCQGEDGGVGKASSPYEKKRGSDHERL